MAKQDEPAQREREHAELMALSIKLQPELLPANVIARGLMIQRQAIRTWLQGNGLCDRQLLREFDEEFTDGD